VNDPQFVNAWLQGATSALGQPSAGTIRFSSFTMTKFNRFRSLTRGPILAVVRLLWFSAGPATLVMLGLQLMEATDAYRPFLKAAFCLTISLTLGMRVFSYFVLNDRQSVYGTRLRTTGLLTYTVGLLAGAGSLLFIAETVSRESTGLRQSQVLVPTVEQPQLAQNDSPVTTL